MSENMDINKPTIPQVFSFEPQISSFFSAPFSNFKTVLYWKKKDSKVLVDNVNPKLKKKP